jgi:hypothetical protein
MTQRDQLEDVGVDWINLAHDADKWRAVVSTVMNVQIAYSFGNVLTT